MTLGQIDRFIQDAKSIDKPLADWLCITGGEALLHPHLEEITNKLKELVNLGYFGKLLINSNMNLPIPLNLQKYISNLSLPKDNPQIHHCNLIHPQDLGGVKQTYQKCIHHRKPRVVVTYHGVSLCCAADAYMRLFNMGDMFLDHLPRSMDEFPNMDKVCQHCPFGSEHMVPFERDRGCPGKGYVVSTIYQEQAQLNMAGRKLVKRYPSI